MQKECDYPRLDLKRFTYVKISPKMVNLRDKEGNADKEQQEKCPLFHIHPVHGVDPLELSKMNF